MDAAPPSLTSTSTPDGEKEAETEKVELAKRPLKIVILTSGTRGDVQPYCCLAVALQKRGHKVAICTEERMRPFVESFGISYRHLAGDPTAVLFTKEGQEMLNDGRVMRLMKDMQKYQESTYEECLQDYVKACEGAEVIISGYMPMTQSYCLAEKNKATWIPMVLGPAFPTGEFPQYFISNSSLPFKWLNKLTYSAMFWMLWKSESAQINKFRTQTLKLPPMSEGPLHVIETRPVTVINAFSVHLIPGEKVPRDWPQYAQNIPGFIFPRPGFTQMHPYFEQFVINGPPPVYLGFGSMPAPNPQKLIDIAAQTINSLGVRAVLVAGWTEITDEMKEKLKKNIYVVDSVPHDWLLPRCSCIVHHCGVGTTAAVLRAGVPSVPCPVYLDQPFWASRLHTLGVASEPIPFQKLSVPSLTAAIRTVLNSTSMKAKAQKIASEISDGTARAVELVEKAAEIPLF